MLSTLHLFRQFIISISFCHDTADKWGFYYLLVFNYYPSFISLHWVLAAHVGYSLCHVGSPWGVWAQLLQLPGSGACVPWLWCMGLVAPGHVESSWTTDQTHVHCISRQILIHHAMREVQNLDILDEFFHLNSSLWPAVQQVLQCIISCSNVRTSSFGLGEILQLMKNNIFSCSTTW